jgi:acetyl-CoA carboxylase biotin carboxyl carrier protein
VATVKPADIEALLTLFEASSWDEMHLQIGDFDLFLSSDSKVDRAAGAAIPAPYAATRPPAADEMPRGIGHIAPPPVPPRGVGLSAPPPMPPRGVGHITPPPVPTAPVSNVPGNWVAVAAPTLGTFYRSPKPGAAPFCELGVRVEAESELCLVEVMKLFTTVRAGTAGIVRKICANDGDLVEFDQVLFYIDPA